MHICYKTKGTCSRKIDIELEDTTIRKVAFTGGCNGNLKGITALVTGMDAKDVVARFKGIRCGGKPTSCPDQLAAALEKAMDTKTTKPGK